MCSIFHKELTVCVLVPLSSADILCYIYNEYILFLYILILYKFPKHAVKARLYEASADERVHVQLSLNLQGWQDSI